MTIAVLRPGLLSTFQDLGRVGFQHLGVPVAGAMDERAHRLANLLAGNDEPCATLEITLAGPRLEFQAPACIALCGADLGATLDDAELPLNRPVVARAGARLNLGNRRRGLRAYLAVHGGYRLDTVMGSESTYLRAGFGGFGGRALARDDRVELRRPLEPGAGLDALQSELDALRIYLPGTLAGAPRATLRLTPGPQWDEFDSASRDALLGEPFRIGAQSDRMGYRLEGPKLSLARPRQMLSEATCFGTVQVPAGGAPIVLMADRQTSGGYPRIAQVAQVDLPQLAQCAPGDSIRFEAVGLDAAQELDARREQAWIALRAALRPLRGLLAKHGGMPAAGT